MPAIPDSTLRAIDFVFDRLANVGFDKLHDDQQHLVCVWAVCGEVDNGGIEQFFFNSSGDWSAHTPTALEVLDAPELAAIIRSAMTAFPNDMPNTELGRRRQQIDDMPDEVLTAWDDLSRRFDTSSMNSKIDKFIRSNEFSIYHADD